MARLTGWEIATWVLLIIGGLNAGMVGLFEFNFIDTLFGAGSGVARTIYTIIGIAALAGIFSLVRQLSEPR